ncbi:MAG: hypothetical protein PUP92_24575 [Rhizonema sp. PD38]|nr:hypothetical protein [Rhizonema sp. PD38]
MAHTKTQKSKKFLFFWLLWVLATAIGGIILGAFSSGDEDYFSYIFLPGLIIGVAQWVVLRNYISHASWWIVASFLGWFLGIFAPFHAMTTGYFGYMFVLVDTSLMFTSLGVAQWLILRRHTQSAGWWVPVSTISGTVYAAAFLTITSFLHNVNGLLYVINYALSSGASWAGSAAVTGIMLAWLLRSKS